MSTIEKQILVPTIIVVESQGDNSHHVYPKAILGHGIRTKHSKKEPDQEYVNNYQLGWKITDIPKHDMVSIQIPHTTIHVDVASKSLISLMKQYPDNSFSSLSLKLCRVSEFGDYERWWLVTEEILKDLLDNKNNLHLQEENFVDIQDIQEGDVILQDNTAKMVTLILRKACEGYDDIKLDLAVASALNKKNTVTCNVSHASPRSYVFYRMSSATQCTIPFLKYLYFFQNQYASGMYEHFPHRTRKSLIPEYRTRLAQALSNELADFRLLTPVPYAAADTEYITNYARVSHLLRLDGLHQLWESFSTENLAKYFADNSELIFGNLHCGALLNSAEQQYPEIILCVNVTRARKKGRFSLKGDATKALYNALIGPAPKDISLEELNLFIQTIGQKALLEVQNITSTEQLLKQLELVA